MAVATSLPTTLATTAKITNAITETSGDDDDEDGDSNNGIGSIYNNKNNTDDNTSTTRPISSRIHQTCDGLWRRDPFGKHVCDQRVIVVLIQKLRHLDLISEGIRIKKRRNDDKRVCPSGCPRQDKVVDLYPRPPSLTHYYTLKQTEPTRDFCQLFAS